MIDICFVQQFKLKQNKETKKKLTVRSNQQVTNTVKQLHSLKMSSKKIKLCKETQSPGLCRLAKQICPDRKGDVSVLVCQLLLRTIYFAHEDSGDQAEDECLNILNKMQTLSHHVYELGNKFHLKKNKTRLRCSLSSSLSLYLSLSFFFTEVETDVKNSTLWSTGFGMA